MQQISTERVWDKTILGEQVDPLGIGQKIEIWPYEQMIYAHPNVCQTTRPSK